jgi:hypothetical protein
MIWTSANDVDLDVNVNLNATLNVDRRAPEPQKCLDPESVITLLLPISDEGSFRGIARDGTT